MFYEEIRIKQGFSYISFCLLRILYNSEFILMATSLGTNAVVVTRVHCIFTIAGVCAVCWPYIVSPYFTISTVYFLNLHCLQLSVLVCRTEGVEEN